MKRATNWEFGIESKSRTADRDEYMRQIYGEPFTTFWKTDTTPKFVTDREFWENQDAGIYSNHAFDNSTESSIQCELATGEFDPRTLPYREYLQWHLRHFCYRTSAHGIPQIGHAKNKYVRGVWIALFFGCIFMLYQNAQSVIRKYNRNEKIVNIELKFDIAPFPSITVCNLNPYKASITKDVDLIKRTLSAFDGAMNKAGIVDEDRTERIKRLIEDEHNNHSSVFEPGYSKCKCEDLEEEIEDVNESKGECDGERFKWEAPDKLTERCICAFDRSTHDAWPCYLADEWTEEMCDTCDQRNFCKKSNTPKEHSETATPCLCAPSGDFCVTYDGKSPIIDIRKYLRKEPQEEEAEFVEAMGFSGMTDEVAIVTKAKENLLFAMSSLSMEERMLLSNSKRELIHKCSFNGKACDIDKDFVTHVDPIFGSCFTYNHDRNLSLSSVRAGPMYGLRILVYVNASDYMPTTEATGVRLTIHDKTEYPFPDTFGFSAPTGFVSSFGLRMRRMTRLPAPYGDCVDDATVENYIYHNYNYSVEGCYRSCFQQMVLAACRCGDPRFPVPIGRKHCKAADSTARKCLDDKLNELGGHHGSVSCKCQQPCRQSIYSVTYSPARWPSESLQIQIGTCNSTPAECTKHYKENGAMVEVFYEQLNFEMLTESEAYGFVNLLADFGGQLGLWCGISFLTCWEFIFLVIETSCMVVKHNFLLYKKRKEAKK